jgi:amidase
VNDLALALRLIAGPDGRDAAVPPVAVGDPASVDLRDLRAAVYANNGISEPTPETADAVAAAAAALRDAGVAVEEALPPAEEQLSRRIWRSYDGDMPSSKLYGVLRDWDRYRTEMLAFVQRFDLLVCPVVAYPAVTHGSTATTGLRETVSYTTPYSLTGWPCVVVRCGWSAERLPIGVQLVARPWRDHVALAAGAHLEDAFGGWQEPPL